MSPSVHAVTGAFGYSGSHLAAELLCRGRQVRNLTGHPNRPDPFGGRVAVVRLPFGNAPGMRDALRGASVLYNTTWVRFEHKGTTFAKAVEWNREILRAAAEAGVERVVHVSITNPSEDSALPYFRGKAQVERAVRESGLSFAILRPALFFGGRDILINNIAYLLRRLPIFGVAPGDYGVQPIHVDDMARLAADAGESRSNEVINAVGPESWSFVELIRLVGRAVGRRVRIVRVPKWILLVAATVVGRVMGDVVLTRHEIEGLCANLLVVPGSKGAGIPLSSWLTTHGHEFGQSWASELERHYR